jgi:hypothetical protein
MRSRGCGEEPDDRAKGAGTTASKLELNPSKQGSVRKPHWSDGRFRVTQAT